MIFLISPTKHIKLNFGLLRWSSLINSLFPISYKITATRLKIFMPNINMNIFFLFSIEYTTILYGYSISISRHDALAHTRINQKRKNIFMKIEIDRNLNFFRSADTTNVKYILSSWLNFDHQHPHIDWQFLLLLLFWNNHSFLQKKSTTTHRISMFIEYWSGAIKHVDW